MHPRISMMLRALSSVLGLLFALPILGLIALAFVLPITISGIGYVIGCALAIFGLLIAPWGRKYSLILVLTDVIVIALVAGTRLVLTKRDRTSNLRVITLPQGKETRWINTLIDEQDSLILGEALFHRIGGDSPWEHEGITTALHTAYSEMRSAQRVFASPFVSTYLGLQRPTSFDTVIIKPEVVRHSEVAVIFLHGYMGNVTAQCWEIAQAAGKFGAITVCPSTDWKGQWWQPEGQAILQAIFRYLREQGTEKFYLGGFSNGGFGISRLVSKLSKEDGLSGLFFIDGIAGGASIKETGLPILIIEGAQDERVPAGEVRQIAEVIGDLATYVELEGDHFIIMKHPKLVQDTITAWLENHEANK
ncbi:MAG TPA: alpha/beta hydrolase [Anaerolineales bacterium]|nr:alpha/beta hydrolase [Anaerolineales bacterium]